eukprot:TRINITY_DN1623_c0_g1_i1.p1 TRINITY_DN1623_c0_g1~~TRINITY_DN1623_c0_g1_i1.p1  ORF type:complete len:403 (+),score=53.32 TRINITY_DN1623_c0_g1_i1:4142-5350(+)
MSIYQKYATSRYSSESKARPVAKAQETVPPALDLPSSPDQLSTVSGQIVSLEERMGNLTRLVKLLQSCVNTQEAETKKIRVDFMSYASNCTFDCKTDQRLVSFFVQYMTIQQIQGMIEGKFEELEKTLNSNQNVNAEKIQGLEKQLIDSEAKIMKAIDEKFSKMREALISREENVNIEGIQEDVNKLNSMLSEWKCGVEEQLNVCILQREVRQQSMKNIVLGKVDAAEVSRVLAMLEEEVERREQGDNKALEVAVHAEELCKELNEIIQKEFGVFVQPETEASTKPNPKPKKTSRKKEKENNDPHYLKTFEKTLTKKLEKGLENIAKIVEKTYYNKPPPVEYDSESDSTSQIGRTVTEISTLNGSLSRSDINSTKNKNQYEQVEMKKKNYTKAKRGDSWTRE